MNKPEIKVDVSIEGIDEATKKAERYVEVLKEAKTLAGELASMHFESSVNERSNEMKLPKKPNYNSKPYPSIEEVTEWSNFVSLVISIVALTIALFGYFFK
ncbi:hypothetical protein MXE73_06890 [Enterococcus faecalis]|uniref:hypothetical protein n=1 Tax=Enterococcus faecalis TaxID=1351 RepID=UPI002DB5E738|nr:hypothetical protein [Enterococcus faecalis]MEB6043244.1 hypothetical protein [Enterococcus faecalis]MEB6172998.1 hypothetical protein [Enterococcus faecalis]